MNYDHQEQYKVAPADYWRRRKRRVLVNRVLMIVAFALMALALVSLALQ